MKKMLIAASMVVVCLATSCQSPLGTKTDAVTAATPGYEDGNTTLPPEADTYEVVGPVDGLRGYVVKYDDTIYRGGEPFAPSAVQALKKYGIRTIISVTPTDHERELSQKHGFTLIEIPFESRTGLSSDGLNQFLQTINTGDGPFYMHCHSGAHRGGLLGVAYRLHIQDWPYEKALLEYGRLGGDPLTDHIMLESVRNPAK